MNLNDFFDKIQMMKLKISINLAMMMSWTLYCFVKAQIKWCSKKENKKEQKMLM